MAEQSFKIYKDTAEKLEKNALDIASLKEDIVENGNGIARIKDEINKYIVKSKNKLYLLDQTVSDNGITVSVIDQNITVNGSITDTGRHAFIDLKLSSKLPSGTYYLKAFNCTLPNENNPQVHARIIDKSGEQLCSAAMPFRSSFTLQTETEVILRLIFVGVTYTYNNKFTFNAQLNNIGFNEEYEKAEEKYVFTDSNTLSNIETLKQENVLIKEKISNIVSLDDTNPLGKIIENGGLCGIFKSIACVGDSLTQGVFDRTNDTSLDFEATNYYAYPSVLGRLTGSKIYNLGNAGATASDSEQAKNDWHSWLQTANQKNWYSDDYKAVAYIISIGTNDIGYYGSFSGNADTDIDVNDYNNNNTGTSVGALATIIQKIREIQPQAIIFVETIDNTRNSVSTRDVANEKIRAVAELLDCYIIDMARYWVSVDDAKEWKKIYQNGGHLNALGYFEKTKARCTYIDWIIRNNLDKFRSVQFIGTNMEFAE